MHVTDSKYTAYCVANGYVVVLGGTLENNTLGEHGNVFVFQTQAQLVAFMREPFASKLDS
jgi:hypothetical protein